MRYRIALCGFSEFEYRAMHFSFQHPGSPEETGYDVVDALAEADFAVVDADSKPAVKGVVLSNRVLHSVFVGAVAPTGAHLHLPRPIDPTRIRRLLDTLSLRFPLPKVRLEPPAELQLPTLNDVVVTAPDFDPPAMPPAAPPRAPAPRTLPALPVLTEPVFAEPVFTELVRAEPARTEPVLTEPVLREPVPPPPAEPAPPAPAAASAPSDDAHIKAKAAARARARRARLASSRNAAAPAEQPRDVLVLDADEASGALLCELLERFGFSAHRVRSIPEAEAQVAGKAFAAIFLDITMGGADRGEGLALLQRIQELPVPEGRTAPAVLMVSAQLNPADRVRAALAGIKSPLVKPVSRGDVARALEGCGVSLPSDARRQ